MNSPSRVRSGSSLDINAKQKAEMKKLMSLVSKSIASTSIKEKNDLLTELEDLWYPQVDALDTVLATNKIKSDELVILRKKLAGAISQADTLKRNTSFFAKADYVRYKHKELDLIDSINTLEKQVKEFHALPHPDRLKNAMELPLNSDIRLFTLFDTNLLRIEDLAYAYKKRLFVVEQSQESTEVVLREYGSINNLIDTVQAKEKENQELKEQESKFIADAFTCRRKLANITLPSTRKLIELLQTLYSAELEAIDCDRREDFHVNDIESSNISFDTISNDPNFLIPPDHFDLQDFGNTTETDLIELIVRNPRESKIGAYLKFCNGAEKTNKKIIREISTSNTSAPLKHEGNLTRIDKLIISNDQLFTRVRKFSEMLDTKNDEIVVATSQICKMLSQRRVLMNAYITLLGRYKRLVNDHIAAMIKGKFNRQRLTSHLILISSMGSYLLRQTQNKSDEYLYNKFMAIVHELEEEDRKAQEQQRAIEESEKASQPEQVEQITPIKMAEMFKLSRLKKRKSGKEKFASPISSSHASLSHDIFETNQSAVRSTVSNFGFSAVISTVNRRLLDAHPKTEVLNALSLVFELSGYVIGVDRKFHETISTKLKETIDILHNELTAHVTDFGKDFNSSVNHMNILANSILVKTKENICIQTTAEPMIDEEIQTTEVGVGKKKTGRK